MNATVLFHSCLLACWMVVAGLSNLNSECLANPLVRHEVATPVGLERAWFAQVRIDSSRNQIVNWTLLEDTLIALTTGGTVHALDTETGKTLWVNQVGSSYYDAVGPAADDRYVAIISGSRLFVLDREDGHLLWSKTVGSAPAAAPALGEDYAFVALIDGRVEGYPLNDPEQRNWYFQSTGRIFYGPSTSGDVFSWPTDRGYLYVARAEPPEVLYRLETNTQITAPPAKSSPYLYVATSDGYVYCIHEMSGDERWQYSTGFSVSNAPAIIEDRLYVASSEPALHAIESDTGLPVWNAPGIPQFVAQGEKNVYGIDTFGRVLIIDKESGKQVATFETSNNTQGLVNNKTDRIFLVTDDGLVQCLHEIGISEPIRYYSVSTAKDETGEPEETSEESMREQPEDTSPQAPETPADNPFSSDDSEGEESPVGDFNPFGF